MEISNFESGIEQNQNNKDSEIKPTKRRYWKFIAGFLGIMVIAGAGFFVWNKYFSPQAKLERQTQENYQKYLNWQTNYEKAMKEDTYGGKTPEETLKMFIEALKKEDIGLASKYFVLREDGSADPKWIEVLKQKKETGQLSNIIDIVSRAVPDKEITTIENTAWFIVYKKDKPKELEADINLHFNTYSQVWGIESL
ncbi:hypothetical protein COS46_02030 [Candidatus Jorgensenbacteria bacterium CG03_land_8_20_14_0_80_38_39]|uniref:DUF4878 domain-containing protein n=2 Tax=Candidatus Joergenseniibacteriota TaxID=1752739 RepID=A0A2H0NBI6_9BACT|nr:MAG: hypothetical protein COV54_02845 [Candidatus Jorgensenbacteria bacterium CG11_big_fil_rev_8_21_14_0_20_38_23]PIV13144.1 MAG: hypothetical protein COS46_02030 [Candidatus Jorgensenbacteria bacterium CG03_land_8_20_14_0_80_38_39]PJA95147.1 MAG: hypothetical protein CO130_00625 [Candidatus Jorgensenbacteria bacterium CG_4_9_14_3_um_filter_38_10]